MHVRVRLGALTHACPIPPPPMYMHVRVRLGAQTQRAHMGPTPRGWGLRRLGRGHVPGHTQGRARTIPICILTSSKQQVP